MKKYYIFAIAILAVVLTSCEDPLNKYPRDSVSSATYFKTENDLKLYSNRFYTILPTASSMFSEVSDEIVTVTLSDEYRGTRAIPTEGGGWDFTMLRHINYMLEHVKQCDDEKARTQYTGVALFFRAYFYYKMVTRFGDVPWYDHTLGNGDKEELNKPRDSRQTVIANVINDLDKAIEYLPDEHMDYRVTKWTAMALKSRVCLFEGTWRKYHGMTGGDDLLQTCVTVSKQLMEGSGYQLYDAGTAPYRSLFARNVTESSEVILSRSYDASLKQTHNATRFGMNDTGRPGFTKRLLNKYLMKDGTRYTDLPGYDTISIGSEMANRDPRMEQTVLRPGYYYRPGDTQPYSYTYTRSMSGYQIVKYVMGAEYDVNNTSENDMPLFRLAEIYLNYAEAKAELGTFTQADADISINKLRDRVHMPHMDVADATANPCPYMESLYPNVNPSNKGVILEIRRERDIELVMEGFRWNDLMRWKEGQSFTQPIYGMSFPGEGFVDYQMDGLPDLCVWKDTQPFMFGVEYLHIGTGGECVSLHHNNENGSILIHGTLENPSGGRKFDEEKDYLYPIPIQERILTEGALTQNPGWKDGLSF